MDNLRKLSEVKYDSKKKLFAGCWECREIFINDLGHLGHISCPNNTCNSYFALEFSNDYKKLKEGLGK